MKGFMLLAAVAIISATTACAQQLVIGTYNIRYYNNGDEQAGEMWSTRCKVMCDQMNYEAPDAFGAQEATYAQIIDMLSHLDGYDYTGRGRDDGEREGEYACIFYRTDRLELLDEGTFWLSETPDKVSFGWDAACRRVCSWGKFRQKESGFTFFHFNLHMDHVGVVARREAARLVTQRIAAIAQGAPVVLTGDFNVDQNDEIYTIFSRCPLLKDCYTASRLRFAENGTYIAFDPNAKTESRIDHIFVSPQFAVDRYAILTSGYWTPADNAASTNAHNGPAEVTVARYRLHTPSDHYPVIARMQWSQRQ